MPTMTPAELANKLGITTGAITKKAQRMKANGALNGYAGGFGINKELPAEVVAFYLGGDKPEPKVIKPPVKPKEVIEFTEKPLVLPVPEAPKHPEPVPTQSASQEEAKPFDLGEFFFFHPTAHFLYVCVLLCCSAYVFGELVELVFPKNSMEVFVKWMYYVAGFLVMASGIMIGRNFNRVFKTDSDTWRTVWLFFFFTLELAVECCYIFYDANFEFSGLVIAVMRPSGLLAYSILYK